MKLVATIAIIFLSACGVESATEDIKIRQAFNIYTVGNYSFVEPCAEAGYLDNTISIGENSIRMGHAVCDIVKLDTSSVPAGPKITLENCRSDSGSEESATIIIESLKDGKTILHGWGDKPVQIYICPTENRKQL